MSGLTLCIRAKRLPIISNTANWVSVSSLYREPSFKKMSAALFGSDAFT